MFAPARMPHRRLPRGGRAPIALAMLFLAFEGSSAEASCGDYVTVLGHGAANRSAAPSDADRHMPQCHGPNCQRQMPSPLAPTKGLISSSPGDSACLPHSNDFYAPRLLGGVVERCMLLAEGHFLLLLRPPSR